MANNSVLAREIVRNVGTIDNVNTLEHCTTRLRFTVRDDKAVDKEALRATPGVLSVIEQGGQLQVVVGNAVADVYEQIGFTGGANAGRPSSISRRGWRGGLDVVFDFISGTFSPLLWALVGSSMVKTLLALFTTFGWLAADSSTYAVLNATGNAVFFFLPIFVGVTAATKLGANPIVGGVVGAALLEPSFTALGTTGQVSSFFGIPMVLMSYSSQVFPVMIGVLLLAVIEKGLRQVLNKNLHLVLIPMLGLLVVVPLTMLVFGPFGVYLGTWIAGGIGFLTSTSSIATGAVLAAGMLFLVTLGLHWALVPIILANLAASGTDTILAGWAGYNFALTGVAVGVAIAARRDATLRTTAGAGAAAGALAGVSEPIVYGVILRYRRLIPILVVAAALGGGINGAFDVRATGFLFQNVFTIPGFQPVGGYLIGIGVAFVAGMVGVLVFGYEKRDSSPVTAPAEPTAATTPAANEGTTVLSPLAGAVLPLSETADEVFASGALGAGVAITPTTGELRAPFDGTVVTVARTGHAMGLTSDSGLELLVHVGIDTVNLGGRHFRPLVAAGDRVAAGDLLLEFDLLAITAAGYDATSPVVVTQLTDMAELHDAASGSIRLGEPLFRVHATVTH